MNNRALSLLFSLALASPAFAAQRDAAFDAFERDVPQLALPRPALRTAAQGLEPIATGALRVVYPAKHDQPFVVEGAGQRIELRALGSMDAAVVDDEGRARYDDAYAGVDAIHVPDFHRSEELLLLRSAGAPRMFEYELVAQEGVAEVALERGRVVFRPMPGASGHLVIEKPWAVDVDGKSVAAQWELSGKIIRLVLDTEDAAYPVLVDPSFTLYTAAAPRRTNHAAVRLADGRVLISGGWQPVTGQGGPYQALADAWIYDPATNAFTPTGGMKVRRAYHTMTLMQNGKVLVIGGVPSLPVSGITDIAEVYDPATGEFTVIGTTIQARYNHTATLLRDGRVLIAGGIGNVGSRTIETYDPAAGTFTAVRSTFFWRSAGHTATPLPNGDVLLIGTFGTVQQFGEPDYSYISRYNIRSNTVTDAGYLAGWRQNHATALLPTGDLLVTSGNGRLGPPAPRATLIDGDTLAATPLRASTGQNFGGGDTATQLVDGRVLTITRNDGSEVYDPFTSLFTPIAMQTPRWYHTATPLLNGKVLVAFGSLVCPNNSCPSGQPTSLDSFELLDPGPGAAVLTTVGSSANPSLPGVRGHLTIHINVAAVGGTVTLYRNGSPFAGPLPVTGAPIAVDGSILDVGTHTFQAQYSGTADLPPSTSNTYVQQVRPGAIDFRFDWDGNGFSEVFWYSSRFARVEMWDLYFTRTSEPFLTPDIFSSWTGSTDWRVAGAGDFDGDTLPEAVMVRPSTREVSIWTALGGGTQRMPAGLLPSSSWKIAGVGDFNGDDRSELLALDEASHTVYVIGVNSSMTMNAPAALLTLESDAWRVAAVADFNGDTKDDILWQNRTTREVVIWLMDGARLAGVARVGTPGESGWWIAGAADFTGDKKTDIVWQNIETGGVAVWVMDFTRLAASQIIYTLSDPSYRIHAIGDYDASGTNDLLWVGERTGQIYVWTMNGLSIKSSVRIYDVHADPAGWTAAGTAPMITESTRLGQPWAGANAKWYAENGDIATVSLENSSFNPRSIAGVIEVEPYGGEIYSLSSHGQYFEEGGWLIAPMADMNRDGRADLVVYNPTLRKLRFVIWKSQPFESENVVRIDIDLSPDWRVGTIGDFDGDTDPDLFFTNSSTGEVAVWLMNGTAIQSTHLLPASLARPGWRIVGAADIDGDHRDDVVWQNVSSGAIEIFVMNGAAATTRTLPGGSAQWRVGGIGDFDRDGRNDLVWQNFTTGDVAILRLGSGPQGITVAETRGLPKLSDPIWRIQGVADYDGNASPDILWRRADSSDSVIWLMSGTGVFNTYPLGIAGSIAGASQAVAP